MPVDPSVYQYCDALDIPVHYLPGYEEEIEPVRFEWKNLFLMALFILFALPLIILVAGMFAVIKLAL